MVCFSPSADELESEELREAREKVEGYLGFSIKGLPKAIVEHHLRRFLAELEGQLSEL